MFEVAGYSAVENKEVNTIDLVENAQKYIIFDLASEYICIKCQSVLRFHKSPKSITLRCKCGCRIFYPVNKEGLKLSTYVSGSEYKKDLKK